MSLGPNSSTVRACAGQSSRQPARPPAHWVRPDVFEAAKVGRVRLDQGLRVGGELDPTDGREPYGRGPDGLVLYKVRDRCAT